MPTRIDLYRFNGQTRLSADTFNRVFTDVDLRIAKLESLEIDWEAATRELTALGLSRITEVLNPLLATGEATLGELEDALANLLNNTVTIEQLTTILLGYVTPDALATALAPKADTATVNSQLAAKADTTTVNSQLATKANITYVDAQIAAIDTGAEVITTLTASTTLTLAQAGQVFVDATGGPITLALPASTSMVSYRFTRVDATTNQVTINRAGTDLLGVSGVTFAPLDGAGYTLRLTANGAGRWMRTYSSPITFRWDVPGTYTWRRPLDATHGELLEIGGGGGGASGGRTSPFGSSNGGQGGGGGSAVKSTIPLPASATITVGAGGAGGAALTSNGNGNSGSPGASSAFGTIVVPGGASGTSPPTAPPIPAVGAGAAQIATPRAGLASHDLSFSAVTAVPFTTDLALDDDGSGSVTLIKTITPTVTTFNHYQPVWPAGCAGGWGANSETDNTPGYAGADHANGYSGLASGPSGAGGKSRRSANADPGQPGGIGSGGGGGGASHGGNSGAGGSGGPGLVVITCL